MATPERKKKSAAKKGMTKSEIVSHLAQASGATKDVATKILDGLAELASKELKSSGVFAIPGIAKLTVKMKKATAARQGRNPATGETITIKAQPAKKVVRARIAKAMKEAV